MPEERGSIARRRREVEAEGSVAEQLSRRNLLAGSGAITASMICTAVVAADTSEVAGAGKPAEKKLKIVVAGGHPGDPEYGCGGTIARLTDLGHEVVLLYLNKGDPRETPTRLASDVRVKEAAKACDILKARPLFAAQIDAHSIVDESHYDQFGKLLETENPDLVFTQWPIDNHRDHRAVSMLAFDAWWKSRSRFALYYYEVSNGEDTLQFSPTHQVDITDVEPRKRAACYAHASQEPDRYYALQDQVALFRGIERGRKRAEGYILLTRSPFDPLSMFTSG